MSEPALVLDIEERKRLGQYFTGEPLARVLAALAGAASAKSVVDPMAGSGDMLAAVSSMGGSATRVTAVEIDPAASGLCLDRLRRMPLDVTVRTADAFSASTWTEDRQASWHLVITNPPYVRYQRTSSTSDGRVTIPSATGIRDGLIEILKQRSDLSLDDRKIFGTLAAGYSGLADLAVPSWILSAALVAPGGRLAMVVPDTWLSRDYALPVLYLLRRCFDIEIVVEDGEASWFEDALVRTTLVVARRVKTRETALAANPRRHVYARLTSAAANSRGLVGALYPDAVCPELAFAEDLRHVEKSQQPTQGPGLEAGPADDSVFGERLAAQAGRSTWATKLEPSWSSGGAPRQRFDLPRRLRDVVEVGTHRLCTLEELGWQVGQGLRTGANRFFYGEVREAGNGSSLVQFDHQLSAEPLAVPRALLRTVVRKQSDLAAAGRVAEDSPGRLLALHGHALEEDIAAAQALGVDVPYEPIPESLAELVRRAARVNLGSANVPRRIPELSAVVTNIRAADANRPDRPPRFWYQLPPLAGRHTGAVFLPRINHGHPSATVNQAGMVVDANFSTFRPGGRRPTLEACALASVLNSSWAVAAMEGIGTVLGGGALKVEATHLRRLPLPTLSSEAVTELVRLNSTGRSESETVAARAAVDAVLWDTLGLSAKRSHSAITDLSSELRHARGVRR